MQAQGYQDMSSATNSESHSKPSNRKYQNIPGRDETHDDDEVLVSRDPLAVTQDGTAASGESDDGIRRADTPLEISVDDAIDRLGMGLFQYRILLAAGLCFAADAMMVLLLSFLSIVLQKEWGLSDDETAFMTSILFAGALVGTSILGPLADKWGRRPVFIIAASIIAVFGVATSMATSHKMVLGLLSIIGFGVGGLTVPFDTLAEFIPAEGRG
mgnify:CR=1 FL=1